MLSIISKSDPVYFILAYCIFYACILYILHKKLCYEISTKLRAEKYLKDIDSKLKIKRAKNTYLKGYRVLIKDRKIDK